MNSLTTHSSNLVRLGGSGEDTNSFSFINSSKSLGIVLDTSGTAFTNNLGAGYSSTAIGLNPLDQNTTCLTLRNGTTQAKNSTILIPNIGSSNFTVYMKHTSRFYTDSIFGYGYRLTSSASSINAGNSFTVTFSSLYPNASYTITGVLSSDLNNASLTGTFTSNYQQIVFTTSASMASTTTFSMSVGTTTLNVSIVTVSAAPIATNVDVSKPAGSTLFINGSGTSFGSNKTTNTRNITISNYYSGTYEAKCSSVIVRADVGPGFLFENNNTNTSISLHTQSLHYPRGTTNYIGSFSTTYNGSTTIMGEWVQIQIPYKLRLTSFSFIPRDYYSGALPSQFVVLGSLDGVNWSSLYVTSSTTYAYVYGAVYNNVATSFTPNQSNNTAYYYFRLAINKIYIADQYHEQVILNTWRLIGDVYA